MRELQTHAATYEASLEHGASPGRARDCNQHWLRTVLGMSRDQRGAVILEDRRVKVMLCLNLEDSGWRKVFEENSTFNFRLRNLVIDLVTEVEVGRE